MRRRDDLGGKESGAGDLMRLAREPDGSRDSRRLASAAPAATPSAAKTAAHGGSSDAAPVEKGGRESETRQAAAEFANQFCPLCSSRLESHRCKMVCRKCGYFMSCSEFE
jgi:ribosomal protein S27AE